MSSDGLVLAADLGGHLVHVIVIGGAVLLGVVVYAVAAVTAPPVSDVSGHRSVQPAPSGERTVARGGRRSRGHVRRAAVAQQIAFLGLCAAAGTHLAVIPDHLKQSWMYGAFFAVVAPMQIGLAWAVLVRARRPELSAALVFCLAVVLLWAVTRFMGVPIGPDNGATEGLGVLDIFATACELITAAALLHLRCSEPIRVGHGLASAWRWSLWSATSRTMLAATVVAVPLLSVFASRS